MSPTATCAYSPATVRQALDAKRYETARRQCLALLSGRHDDALCWLLHEALCRLGDIPAALDVLGRIDCENDDGRLAVLLAFAEDYTRFSAYDFYRGSASERAGLTGDEYEAHIRRKAGEYLEQAGRFATTEARRARMAATLRRCGQAEQAEALAPTAPAPVPVPAQHPPATGSVQGMLRFPDGTPVRRATVTLGLHVDTRDADPWSYLLPEMHYRPVIGEQRALTTTTDDDGRYHLPDVPVGRHEFLAVTLDPLVCAIPTRFLAHGIAVAAGQATTLHCTVAEWESAPARALAQPFPEQFTRGGITYQRVLLQEMRNPFAFDFPRQFVTLPLPADAPEEAATLLLLSSEEERTPVPFQLLAGRSIGFFAALPGMTDRCYALYRATAGLAEPFAALPPLTLRPEAGEQTAVLESGVASFRLPYGTGAGAVAPLLAVRGVDGVWRGEGRWRLPAGVEIAGHTTETLAAGPLRAIVRVSYAFTDGHAAAFTFTADRDEPYLLVHEVSSDIPAGAFEFSLREFSGGRGFLHWKPECGDRHWRTLAAEAAELARLQESIPWWIPPHGFGYAMTADGLAGEDYLGVFTVRRGEWIDRKFAALTQGPGDDNRELDWPYLEMIGSTISMITAHTDASGDAFFRFAAFDGERQWGVLVSSLARNDGPIKEISLVQHKVSSPCLQEFCTWTLDAPDAIIRPALIAQRDELIALREKKTAPMFARYWEEIVAGNIPGPVQGLRFAVDNDPLIAWRIKRNLVGLAPVCARMILYGRDYSDMYSPVGARAIAPWAEEFDLIAASGVFTPEEERTVRQFLLLMAHMYQQPDLMNWHYGARNANFEADRVGTVGTVGLAFRGHPDTAGFLAHVCERITRMLDIYCTPGSGKWYENPACYYFQSLKCYTTLAFQLDRYGVCAVTNIPRMKDFLRWGTLMLTPPSPHAYEQMCNAASDAEYREYEKVRRIAPIGDHAHLGPWIPEHYALMAKCYREVDPAFADTLLWAYQAGGMHGGYHGNIPLLFAVLREDDLTPVPPPPVPSRRLEGFGAVFHGRVGTPEEFYLLAKLGPGGYRFHRTEGSFLLFADGKPLVYDGGEAGETWRHSTLSFYDVHMPLAPGHIERFCTLPTLDFAQGVHPVALKPGEPVFLSDVCHHQLVPVAYHRYAEPDPADVRAFLWVKDDYVIVYDDLHIDAAIPSHWHLQVVAEDETGTPQDGMRFRGRFGTDLQVLLPEQSFTACSVEPLTTTECNWPRDKQLFAMRHLQLTAAAARHYLAVLRPLPAGAAPVNATLLHRDGRMVGVRVMGEGIDDHVFLSRDDGEVLCDNIAFAGRYGAVLRRPDARTLALMSAGTLTQGADTLTSDGPAVSLRYAGGTITLSACGEGTISVVIDGQRWEQTLWGETVEKLF